MWHPEELPVCLTVSPPCLTSFHVSFSSFCCRHWADVRLAVSLTCVGLCAAQRGVQDGSFMPVSLSLPIWRRWCRSESTLLASPVETHLRDSAHWSVMHTSKLWNLHVCVVCMWFVELKLSQTGLKRSCLIKAVTAITSSLLFKV